jgi:hypothetical protein
MVLDRFLKRILYFTDKIKGDFKKVHNIFRIFRQVTVKLKTLQIDNYEILWKNIKSKCLPTKMPDF